jgi:predicted SprT family Zn-dependent metalloprotease
VIVTSKSIKAAYDLLRVTAFSGVKVRPSSKVEFVSKRMKKYHGLYHWPEHRMEIDSQIGTVSQLLQVVAHEMTHAVLDSHGNEDHPEHDENFQRVANIICFEMGWPEGSV